MTLSYDEAALEDLSGLPKKQQQHVVNKIDRPCHPLSRHYMLKDMTTIDGAPLYRAYHLTSPLLYQLAIPFYIPIGRPLLLVAAFLAHPLPYQSQKRKRCD